MPNKRIVLTRSINQSAIDMLNEVATVELAPAPDEQTMMGLLDNTIGLVARLDGRVTQAMIDACSTLRVIGRPGAGYDTVDVAVATQRKIPVVFAPVNAFAVAEGALAMLMTLVKNLPLCDKIVKDDKWLEQFGFMTGDMAGHTLGIVGLGRIGSYFARLTCPFEMTVLGYDPVLRPEQADEMGVKLVDLDELYKQSDYVSLHVPLNEQTCGMINCDTVSRMKKGAILINTARGKVVESLDVLADALETGQLSAVGLDTFPIEPADPSHRIFKNPNCICAPHVLGASKLGLECVCQTMAQGMIDVLNNRKPQYCVNPEVFE